MVYSSFFAKVDQYQEKTKYKIAQLESLHLLQKDPSLKKSESKKCLQNEFWKLTNSFLSSRNNLDRVTSVAMTSRRDELSTFDSFHFKTDVSIFRARRQQSFLVASLLVSCFLGQAGPQGSCFLCPRFKVLNLNKGDPLAIRSF